MIKEGNGSFEVDLFNQIPVNNEEYIQKAVRLSEDLKHAQEIVCKNMFPNAEVASPEKWKTKPDKETFVLCNDEILYKNDMFTIVVTRKRNPIMMVFNPIYENSKNDYPRLAYIGHYKDILKNVEKDRFIIFLHGSHNYVATNFKLDPPTQIEPPKEEEKKEEKKGWWISG